MLHVFLTDSQKNIEFSEYPSHEPIKFMMNFKKIFPSISDLLLPILPENESDIHQMIWESTEESFALFQLLLREWANVELRLTALSQYKTQKFANQIVFQAQEVRKNFQNKQQRLQRVHADYIFLQAIHSFLDAELIEIGMSFYLPTLRENWKNDIPATLLNFTVDN